VSHRLPNPRLAKIHRSYTVDEVARLFDVHRNTVRAWIKRGLETCDDRRPTLILGSALRKYLQTRRVANKQSCAPGELYCVRCRSPRRPAGDMADLVPSRSSSGRLVGLCPQCGLLMNRQVSIAKLEQIRDGLEITVPRAGSRIGDTTHPFVNSDFNQGASDHGKAQS